MKGIEATIQNQASHVVTAVGSAVTAIGSAVTAASIPFEASAGITQTCVGIAVPCHDTGSNFLFPIIAMGFGLTFVVVSMLCQLWPKKSILLSAVSFMSSLLAWTLSTLLLGITQELYNTAQHVKSRTDGNLEHGFIYTGSLVNFILICLHLLSSIGIFIMDFNEYIPYNNGNQYHKSDNGGGWKKLQEYETQGIQQLASVWKRS